MSTKKSWDDIPTLEGLEVDWKFESVNPLGKRSHARMKSNDVTFLIEDKNIPIKIVTTRGQLSGFMHDLSEGGVGIDLNIKLLSNQTVKVGFVLGRMRIICKAIVKWVRAWEDGFRIGVMFVNLKHQDSEYISGLYSAQKIKLL